MLQHVLTKILTDGETVFDFLCCHRLLCTNLSTYVFVIIMRVVNNMLVNVSVYTV